MVPAQHQCARAIPPAKHIDFESRGVPTTATQNWHSTAPSKRGHVQLRSLVSQPEKRSRHPSVCAGLACGLDKHRRAGKHGIEKGYSCHSPRIDHALLCWPGLRLGQGPRQAHAPTIHRPGLWLPIVLGTSRYAMPGLVGAPLCVVLVLKLVGKAHQADDGGCRPPSPPSSSFPVHGQAMLRPTSMPRPRFIALAMPPHTDNALELFVAPV